MQKKKNSQRKHAKEKQKKINVLNETSPFTEKTFVIAKKPSRKKQPPLSKKNRNKKHFFKTKSQKNIFEKNETISFFFVMLFLLKKTQTFDKKRF